MAHLALYRKYRSQTFGDLVGQEHVVRTLQNSITLGRISHAYLFTGPRGTGKTSTARLLAKALNCENGSNGEPCNACDNCLSISAGTAIDVMEMDAASEATVEQVRDKIVSVSEYRPVICRYKIFIIDEVHDLSSKAFDALLKTIEEPPEHLVFILATTEDNKVPPTIRSRCQQYEFHRASLSDLIQRLNFVCEAEAIEAEPNALTAIARMADGGYRDALTLLEQAMITADGPVTIKQVYDQLGLIRDDQVDELLLAIRHADPKTLIERLQAMYHAGRDPRSVLMSLTHRLSDLTRAIYGVEIGGVTDATVEANLHATAAQLGVELLSRIREKVAECQRGIREVSLPRLWLEAELLVLTSPVISAAPVARAVVAEKPATAAMELPKPSVARSAKEPAHAEASPAKPAPAEPRPTPTVLPPSDESLAPATTIWQRVVTEMALMSRAALPRLDKSKVMSHDGNMVTVGLTLVNLEWVNDKPKFRPTLNDLWTKAAADYGWTLDLVAMDGTPESVNTEASVHRALEGERLQQVGREVFDGL